MHNTAITKLDDFTFDDFLGAIHKNADSSPRKPFPWQRMLLEQVMERGWPDLLDLPTASGKTSCIDVAVFALALQATRPWQERTTPRRIFFVVDRRIVVDEAFNRASTIANSLGEPQSPVLRAVADRLRQLSRTGRPLIAARLRGGVSRDNTWADIPTQPAIITATVDQVGSRLLFRSYGGGAGVAPIHAALTAYDSLIVLDEAHCSVPFAQTADAVRDYLDPARWSRHKEPLARPLQVMIMTATPPDPDRLTLETQFPMPEHREAALDDALLRQRFSAPKLATLEKCKKDDALEADAVRHALEFAKQGRRRIAIMVNRVKAAQEIEALLRGEKSLTVEQKHGIVLLTGRMRPIDRDEVIENREKQLKAGSPVELAEPIFLVTTQCLEVGADFSFDALITECASLDALLQRFGRLDRLGQCQDTRAVILARAGDLKIADDPIYGEALAKTWNWLTQQAGEGPIDFGIDAMHARRAGMPPAERIKLLASSPDAPVLMPAHVDLLCQTAPRPVPDPDVAAYLHGLRRDDPEVRVVFREDLAWDETAASADNQANIARTLETCPPNSLECLSVPLSRLKKWLSRAADAMVEDVEGIELESRNGEEDKLVAARFAVRRERRWVVDDKPSEIRPNDLVVLWNPDKERLPQLMAPPSRIDRAEEAYFKAGRQILLRVHPAILQNVGDSSAVARLLEWAKPNDDDAPDPTALRALLADIAHDRTVPPWLKEVADKLSSARPRKLLASEHPCDPKARIIRVPCIPDPESEADDSESESSGAVPLHVHLADAANAVDRFTVDLATALQHAVRDAARWHDLGKLDFRFQVWLRDGDEAKAADQKPIAKSGGVIRASHPGFRHEMFSTQWLEHALPALIDTNTDRDLLLHLIAAHHGHARPFVPPFADEEPPDVTGELNGRRIEISSICREQMIPPHQLDSGIPDRFWRLTRRFGWWGLAYLEAMLRLADWQSSEAPSKVEETEKEERS